MTLDETIKTYEELSKTASGIDHYQHYAVGFKQIADWLKLLKRILESGDCNDCALLNSQCRYAPRWGEQVRYNCHMFVREEGELNVKIYY